MSVPEKGWEGKRKTENINGRKYVLGTIAAGNDIGKRHSTLCDSNSFMNNVGIKEFK